MGPAAGALDLRRGGLDGPLPHAVEWQSGVPSPVGRTVLAENDRQRRQRRPWKEDVGVGLVATKRFYFGVGGGTDAFVSACEALSSSTAKGGRDDADRDGEASRLVDLRLCVRVARSYDTGNANIRDLLEVTCRVK